METSSIRQKVEEYFTSINSTANRLMADVESIKQQKGETWDQMSYNEQSEALWRSLVQNEIEEKYNRHPRHVPEVDYFPVLRIRPGEKIVVDDESANSRSGRPFGCSWRDEHSAPFSWETQSQLDLRLCGFQKKNNPPAPPDKLVTKSRLPTPDPSGPRTPTSMSTMRPKNAPPPPPVDYTLVKPSKQEGKEIKEQIKDSTKILSPTGDKNTIPKTGFDFLDNW